MRIILCVVLFLSFQTISFATERNVDQLTAAKDALSRYICFEVYWWGRNYPVGPLPLQVKINQRRFLAWVEDIEASPRIQVIGFYTGRLKDGRGAVISMSGHNAKLSPPDRTEYEAVAGDPIADTLTVPTDCTPTYDPITPQKERMLETVVSTLRIRLSSFVRNGVAKYPKEVTLTIADFNVDYFETYILVDPPNDLAGELYTVNLHDPTNYDGDEYERDGEYPFGVRRLSERLVEKIRRHGIIRKIRLDP